MPLEIGGGIGGNSGAGVGDRSGASGGSGVVIIEEYIFA